MRRIRKISLAAVLLCMCMAGTVHAHGSVRIAATEVVPDSVVSKFRQEVPAALLEDSFGKQPGADRSPALKEEAAKRQSAAGGMTNRSSTDAVEVYRAFLAGKSAEAWFAAAYLDNDKVPELIFAEKNYSERVVYTCRNGKMVKLGTLSSNCGYGYYRKKGVITRYYAHGDIYGHGMENTTYLGLNVDRLTEKLGKGTNSYRGMVTGRYYSKYDNRGVAKKISKSKFRRELRKLVGKKKVKMLELHGNTASNRARYLR